MNDKMNLEDLARVNVVGSSGSGKSYFSMQLAAKLGHPRIELDCLFWGPDWTECPDNILFEKLETALNQPNWVLDGNYDRTISIKWKSVTAVIWIDYSFTRTLYQATRRALHRIVTQSELWPGTGNRESIAMTFFSRKSILLWTIQNYHRIRKRYEARMTDPDYKHIKFVRVKSPEEAKMFLDSIQKKINRG